MGVLKRMSLAMMLIALATAIVALSEWDTIGAASKESNGTDRISVMVDDEILPLKSSPILMEGRMMFPARDTLDALGASVSLKDGIVVAVYNGVKLEGALHSTKLSRGEQILTLPTTSVILGGRLHVPAQFIAYLLDKDVAYDRNTKVVRFGYSEEQKLKFTIILYEAARNGDAQTIEKMISRGVEVNKVLTEYYGDNTALDYAILNNHTEAARSLLSHGGTYAPGRAFDVVRARNGQLMELLLSHGLDPNLRDHDATLLTYASGRIYVTEQDGNEIVITPSLQIVKLLLEYGADPSQDNSLSTAIQSSNYPIVQTLLRHGADPYRVDPVWATPYEIATLYGIEDWLTLQPEQAIPVLSVLHMDGTPLLQGTIELAAGPGFAGTGVHWGGEDIYLDVTDGEYEVHGIMAKGAYYLYPERSIVRIEQAKASPRSITLPKINYSVTLEHADKEQKNGYLALQDLNGNHLAYVEVAEGRFDLSLPPGSYRFGSLTTFDKRFEVTGIEEIIVKGSEEDLQQLTLRVGQEIPQPAEWMPPSQGT